jgi:hypothetical protein
VTTPPDALPDSPASLSPTVVSSTAIDLAWPDVAGETYYQVERRFQTGGVWGSYSSVASPAANTVTYSDTGLSANTTYSHRVRACNALGCSAWRNGPGRTTPAS